MGPARTFTADRLIARRRGTGSGQGSLHTGTSTGRPHPARFARGVDRYPRWRLLGLEEVPRAEGAIGDRFENVRAHRATRPSALEAPEIIACPEYRGSAITCGPIHTPSLVARPVCDPTARAAGRSPRQTAVTLARAPPSGSTVQVPPPAAHVRSSTTVPGSRTEPVVASISVDGQARGQPTHDTIIRIGHATARSGASKCRSSEPLSGIRLRRRVREKDSAALSWKEVRATLVELTVRSH